MSEKKHLYLLWTNADPITAENMVFMYITNSLFHGWWGLHTLKGDREGLWAVNVSGNWRVVFGFKDGHAYIVNYEDYH